MKLQTGSTTMGYVKTLKNVKVQKQTISQLFLDEDKKKNNKPRFEVKQEGGYIRKYIVKANGDKILIMETKQTQAQEGIQSNEAGGLIDIAHDMLLKQLEKSSDPQKQEKQTISAWEKESGILKYQKGI